MNLIRNILSTIGILTITFSISNADILSDNTSNDASAAIYQTEDTIYLTIDGASIQSTDDIHQIFIKAFNLPNYERLDFKELEALLSSNKISEKSIHIMILSGELLKYKIGESKHQELLDCLNNSEEKNLDDSGFKKLFILYWQ